MNGKIKSTRKKMAKEIQKGKCRVRERIERAGRGRKEYYMRVYLGNGNRFSRDL
jgi:hypothetical protein